MGEQHTFTPEEQAFYDEFLAQDGLSEQEFAEIEQTRIRICQSQTKKSSLPEGYADLIKPGWFYAPTGIFQPRDEIVCTVFAWNENGQLWEGFDPKNGDQHPWCYRIHGGGFREGDGHPAKEIAPGVWVPDRDTSLRCNMCSFNPFIDETVRPEDHPHQANPKLSGRTCDSVRLFGIGVYDSLDDPTEAAFPATFSVGKIFYTKEARKAALEIDGKWFVSFQALIGMLASKHLKLAPKGIRVMNTKVLMRTTEIETESGNAFLPVFHFPEPTDTKSMMTVLHRPSKVTALTESIVTNYMLPAAVMTDQPAITGASEPYDPAFTGAPPADVPDPDDDWSSQPDFS